MSYRLRRSLRQSIIKLMLLGLIASTLAGLIPPPLVRTLAPSSAAAFVEAAESLLPTIPAAQAAAPAAPLATGLIAPLTAPAASLPAAPAVAPASAPAAQQAVCPPGTGGTPASTGTTIPLTNTATVRATQTELNLTNNTDDACNYLIVPPPTPNGVLTLTKTVIGSTNIISYTVTVNGPNNYLTSTTVTAGTPKVLTGLAQGIYTVTETSPGQGWMTTYTVASNAGQVLSGQAVVSLTNPSPIATFAAVPVSGQVYHDYNSDGQITANGTVTDTGVSGVTVTAYGVNGACGSTPTNSTGNYSFTPTCAGPWQIVLSNLPSDYEPTTHGAANGTSVQAVNLAAATGVNFGVLEPCDYCQNNPTLATTIFRNGDPLAAGNNVASLDALVSWPYGNVTANGAPASLTNQGQTGAMWGLAYQRETRKIFGAAVVRRHSGLGPNGLGAIYQRDLNSGATSLLVNVSGALGVNVGTIGSNSARGLPSNTTQPSADNAAFSGVGRVGIGDLDLSNDGKTLFFTNLAERNVYGLNIGNPATTPTTATRYDLPATTCTNGVARPWALKSYRDTLYAGVLCTAEASGGITANLVAYVYAMDLTVSSPAFATTPVLTAPLSYPKGCAEHGTAPIVPNCQWNAWTDNFASMGHDVNNQYVHPQPIFTDIEFDVDGSMILAFADRTAMQLGDANFPPNATSPLVRAELGGDLLRAWPSGVNQWTLENRGDKDGPGPFTPTANNLRLRNNNTGPGGQGPGNGEFYYDEVFGRHEETGMGAVAFLPGSQQLVATSLNPDDFFQQGIQKYSNNTGAAASSFVVIAGLGASRFGKAVGLGDVELLCDPAPIEIGNRVWNDLDGDGVQDAGEPGLSGIQVSLRGPTTTVTTNTDSNGLYYFGNLRSYTAYTLTVNVPADYNLSAANQTALSGGSAVSNHAISDTLDSDAVLVGTLATIYYSTGGPGQNNHGLEFGFTQPVKNQVNIFNKAPRYDWGDLPDASTGSPTGPTYNTDNIGVLGASHVITPGLRIGALVDEETVGQPNATATGDDTTGTPDDEEGVTLPQFAAGVATVVTVTLFNTGTGPAVLYGFIDFNGDGNFNDAGETVTRTVNPAAGSQTVTLTFTPPLDSYTAGPVGARFRLSTDATLGADGAAGDGEVEDYLAQVKAYDWGDLPDASAGSTGSPTYNTDKTGVVGPSHAITPGLLMGSFEDAEIDGQPDATATGDDTQPTGQADDEEGVTLPTALTAGLPADFVVRVVNPWTNNATVYGFVDWNGDGDFNDGNERVSVPAASSGDFTLRFSVPLTANTTSLLGARFRLSTDANLGPDGPASDGEVEDYLVRVGRYDFGDLPDDDSTGSSSDSPNSPGYNTNLTGTLGASHYMIPGLQLGATEDNEIDGQPNATATGDGADEDAVTLPAQIIAGNTVVITTTVLNNTGAAAVVYGFVDWNGDGDFADASETVTRTVSSGATAQTAPLTFAVPLTADTTQQLGARFRLSSQADLTADGPARDGEVEDYLIRVQFFDLALRKTVSSLSTTPLAPGISTVTYNLAVVNQGTVTATNIAVTDSIDLTMFQAFDPALNPNGATTGSAALPYTWSAAGVATLNGALAPGQTVNLPITLRIAANTLGQTLANYAEIARARDGNGQPVTDRDSTPENTQQNQNGDNLVDDRIDDDGTLDEDDHDVAYVSVRRFDLALIKSVTNISPTPLVPGVSVVTFTITVFNQGDLTTTLPITVVDYPQAGFTFNAADNPGWNGADPSKPVRLLTTPIGPGSTLTTTIALRVTAGITGGTTLYNFAEITDDGAPVDADSLPDNNNDEAGPNPTDDTDDSVKDDVTDEDGINVPGDDEDDHDVATVIVPIFDLALIKEVGSVSTTPLVPGSTIVNFTLTVYNQGEVPAKEITLADYVTLSDFVFDPNLNPDWSNSTPPTITLAGPLAPGEAISTTITLLVARGTAGRQLQNLAEIVAATDENGNSPEDVDSTPDDDNSNDGTPKDNNTAEDHKTNPNDDEDDHDPAVVTVGAFDLALVKRVGATDLPLLPGGYVTFTLEIFNQGDLAATDPITVVDYVSTTLFTFEPARNPTWDGSDPANPLTVINNDIAPGQSLIVPLVLRVNTGTAGRTLSNYAEIANSGDEPDRDSTPDRNPGNDGPVTDDATGGDHKTNPNEDEDDHDIASVVIPPPVALGNYVWLDLNRDGLQAGENGLAGATVQLFQVLNGGLVITPAKDIDGNLVASLTTTSTGLYSFTNLAPGEYVVRVTPPAGYGLTQGGADPDDNDNTDSNGVPVANQAYVQSLPVLLTVGLEPQNDDVSQNGLDTNGNGTVDFGFVERRDWGDLPDQDSPTGSGVTSPNYNTNGTGTAGPSHLIVPGLQIGALEDDEVDGWPNATATGDDNLLPGQPDDEDGVSLPTAIIADTTVAFTVTLVNTRSQSATLYGFVDWNGDGDFDDLNEAVNKPITQLPNTQTVVITFTVPATATTTLDLGARFRLSSNPELGPDGAADDGEVEDYLVRVTAFDWGDLPDGNANNSPNYPTSSTNAGPSHQIVPGLGIGPVIDNEVNGQPNSTAAGDDNAGFSDDEDGVQIPANIQQGQSIVITVTVVNTTGRSATLYGFVDWNGDGDFADSGERIIAPANSNGPVLLNFNVPLTATITQQVGARFRLSSDAGLDAVGRASDGEVEDYLLAVGAIYDWGDLPDASTGSATGPTYQTLAANGGPSHAITPTLRLGAVEDNEADGQPNSTASGDDSNLPGLPDDEDGIALPTQFIAGASATVTATVLNNTGRDGTLYGFIDWNGDGDFSDLGETQTVNVAANAASQAVPLNFTVPATATTTSLLGARFRLSTDPALGPHGPASDGEVEDYLIRVTAYDWGDLPDDNSEPGSPDSPGYNTDKMGTTGPSHVIIPGLGIGASEDAEADGQPEIDASGDDANGSTPDDEDGVTIPAKLYPGQSAVITVTVVNTTGQAATLYAFIDWNGDGDFGDTGETTTALANSSGTVLLNFNIPPTATITQSVGARFRLSTDTGLGPDGPASNGEVEDYLVKLTPPLSLGNQVWEDANNNGVIDNSESGISGVRVKLFAGDGVTEVEVGLDGILGTNDDGPGGVLTDASGHYLFAQLPPGDYLVEVTQPAGYTSSTGTNASSSGAYEPAPDEDTTPRDSDDNGTLIVTTTVRSALVTLVVGGEPLGETDLGNIPNPATDANSNLQVDFGFYQPLSLGNEVWFDLNNDGLRQQDEPYIINGVRVNLYFDADNNGQLNGGETSPISSTTTVNGLYLFAHLQAGNYLVELAASNFDAGGLLVGYVSSVGVNGVTSGPYEGALTPDPDNDATDGDDNGSTVGVLGSGGSIRSPLVTLTVGGEPGEEEPDNDLFTPDRNENLTVDFGVFRPLSLGNLVWNDRNNDGLYDADGADDQPGTADDERGLDNVVVELLDMQKNLTITTNTADGGRYLFPNLTPGDYVVRIIPPPGYVSSTGANGLPTGPYEAAPDPDDGDQIDNDDNGTTDTASGKIVALPVTLSQGSEPQEEEPDNDPATPDDNENLTVDFGLFLPATLGNRVWYDVNKDGVQDNGENGVPGVVVRLYISPTLVTTTTTDSTGYYTFTNLSPGDYVVEFDLPPGYVRSPQDNAGSDPNGDTVDSDADPLTGQTVRINLTPGEIDLTWDAGIYFDASLGDRVWFDQNANGLQDGGEPGVPNVTVTLLDGNGQPVPTVNPTQTDADGNYAFPNLPPGNYQVQFTLPSGYVITQQDVGANNPISDTADSDVNPADSKTAVITLDPNEHDPTWDAGIYIPVSLGNLVWEDKNNNGLVDDGESGIPNVPVKLYAADSVTEIKVGPDGRLGTVDDNAGDYLTNGSGNYLFANLKPGDYVVGIVAPAGYTSSTGVNGSASGPYEPASDPDNDRNNDDNGSISSGTVASGQVIKSAPVTLLSGGEPAAPTNDDGDSDSSSNLTVDFGLYRPLSLGNLVWYDVNNDGLFDANGVDDQPNTADDEVGLSNVTVQLYAADGTTLITSTQTNSSGHYLFINLTAGEYIVAVLRSTVPPGYVSSTGQNGSPTGPNEPAPDEDTLVLDNDDNGSAAGPLVVTQAITLTVGGEPQNEADGGDIANPVADANSNTQVDFGFYIPLSLGNLVWEDRNNNGRVDEGEPGLDDVVVKLYTANGTTLLAETLTDNMGYYRFDHLAPGDYVVVVEAPIGYTSSTGINGSATGPYESAPDPDNDVNNDDNGTVQSGTPASGVIISSSPVTLSVGDEPAAPTNDDGDSDANSNLSVDFGLFQPLSLGNRVWNDSNNNGKVDETEAGIPNVTVNLFGPDGQTLIATTQTNATGHYLFTNLIPGDYIVAVVTSSLPAGMISSTGKNGSASGPYEPAPDEDGSPLDNDDNGASDEERVASMPVTLSANGEPQGEPDAGDIADNAEDADSNLQVDFGFFLPARLGDRVWLDSNRDGVQDGGESGVPGVTVRLYDSQNNLVATTTTGENGLYLFDNLSPGDYVVEFVLPIGYARSPLDTGGNTPTSDGTDSDADLVTGRTVPVNLSAGESDLTWDAGIYFNASLGDRVWYDSNADGLQDAGEPGVPGVTVTLFNSQNQPVGQPVLTDQNGNYAFPDLPPGDYYVQFTLPPGYVVSPQDTGGNTAFSDALDSDVNPLTGKTIVTNIGLNEHDPTWDAGIYEPVSLGNLIWEDVNNNGKVDDGEAGIPNVPVRLYRADGTPVGAAILTDADGHYLFTNLPPGQYYVEIEAPNGYATSTGLPGSYVGLYEPAPSPENNVNNDDNGSATGGVIRSNIVTLTPSQEPVNDEDTDANSNLTVDFGLYRPVTVGDYVWLDKDGDGVQENGEPGVANVKVTLYNAATDLPVFLNGVPLTDRTDANGLYLFENLPPGDYYVVFDKTTLPAGHIVTQPNVGADDKDSDADSSGRTPSTGFLPSGSQDVTLDLGIYQPVTVGDYVWIDSNDNGLQDNGEPGVKGVTVVLHDATSGTPVLVDGKPLTTQTDSEGKYLFPNLPPGNYYIVFELTTLPPGYVPVQPNQGADDKDSDADSNGKTPPTGLLESGQSNVTLDLGIQLPPNLVLTKDVVKTEVAPGEVIVYTLVYSNTGVSSARSTVVTETVPTGMTFEPGQSTAGWQCANNGAAGATCRFELGTVAPGQSGVLRFAVKLGSNVSALTVIPNLALVGTTTQELRLDDNDDRADVRVQAPQAVSLALFSAEIQNGAIVLRWQTSVELRTAGYHIYRSKDGLRRNARQLTTALIPSQGLQGGDYAFTDREVELNQTYTYWLVETTADGQTYEYGPIRFGIFANKLFLPQIGR